MKTKRKWILWGVAGAVFLYTILGFLVLPWVLKIFAIGRLEEQLNGSISVDSIATNPYTLSLKIQNLTVADENGESVAGFENLYANASIASIWMRGLDLERFELTKPDLHIAIDEARNLNLRKLVDPILRAASGKTDTPGDSIPAGQTGPTGSPVPVRIGLFKVADGQILFTDDSTSEPVRIEATPINFKLTDFHSDPEIDAPYQLTMQLASGATVRWEGRFSLFPLRSRARVDVAGMRPDPLLPYLGEIINFSVLSAEVHMAFEYNFDPLADDPVFNIRDIDFELNDLVLAESTGQPAFLKLSNLRLEGMMVDFQGARLTAQRAGLTTDFLRIKRLPDGRIDVLDHILPVQAAAVNLITRDFRIPEVSFQRAYDQLKQTFDTFWDLQVPEITLRLGQLEFTDLTIQPSAAIRLNDISLTLTDITSQGTMPILSELAFAMETGGQFAVELTIPKQLEAADARFVIDDFALPVLSPYTAALADLDVDGGLLSTTGSLHLESTGLDAPIISLDGQLDLKGFSASIGDTAVDATVEHLAVTGFSGVSHPMDLGIQSIDIRHPQIRIRRVAPPEPIDTDVGSTNTETIPEDSMALANEMLDALNFRLGSLRIRNGRIDFEDASLDPVANLNLEDFQMETGAINLPATEAVPVSMKGRFKYGGTFAVDGRVVSDLQSPESTLNVTVDDMALPPYSTYGENFIGYAIEAGALSLATNLESEGTTFTSASDVRLNRFSLSTTPSGKASLGVPIHLGLALLTDRNQQLELRRIEVFGDIADPRTRVSGLVVQAIVTVFGKVATAPFAILGSLVGGDADDLEQLPFVAGSSDLDTKATDQLRSLAEALHQRPALNLIITPVAAPDPDINAYRQRAVQAQFDGLLSDPNPIDWKPLQKAAGIGPAHGEAGLWALLLARQSGIQALMALLPATGQPDAPEAAPSEPPSIEPEPISSSRSIPRRRRGKRVFSQIPVQNTNPDSTPKNRTSQQTVPKTPAQALTIPVIDIRDQLAAAVNVPGDYLESLALLRAQNVSEYLATRENISPERIQIADPETNGSQTAIRFSLGPAVQ